MRRPVVLAVAAAALIAGGALLAGCGDQGTVTATPQTVQGTVPKPTESTPTLPSGDPVAGKTVFTTTAGCAGCHTLEAAGSTGTVGPNLDEKKPPLALIVDRVTNGKGVMPSFKASLSPKQIADVAAFVFKSTHP